MVIGYPKKRDRKRRIRHPASILHAKDGTCWLCMHLENDYRIHKELEEHHVFPGNPGRRLSEEHGLKVYLCRKHHREGPAAVHNNPKNMRLIQGEAQRIWEQSGSRAAWMKLFGRNYREDE